MITEIPLSLSAVLLGASQEDLSEGVSLAIVGISIVFLALIMIWLLLSILLKLSALKEQQERRAAPPAAPAPAQQSETSETAAGGEEEMDPEILAVIMASVMAVTRSPVRLRQIQRVTYPPTQAWAEHGRTLIHTSHRIRKN